MSCISCRSFGVYSRLSTDLPIDDVGDELDDNDDVDD